MKVELYRNLRPVSPKPPSETQRGARTASNLAALSWMMAKTGNGNFTGRLGGRQADAVNETLQAVTLVLSLVGLNNERCEALDHGGTFNANYQVVYQGKFLPRHEPGGLVFLRPRECGEGYWLGRTLEYFFHFEVHCPVSLSEGIVYLFETGRSGKRLGEFDADFTLNHTLTAMHDLYA